MISLFFSLSLTIIFELISRKKKQIDFTSTFFFFRCVLRDTFNSLMNSNIFTWSILFNDTEKLIYKYSTRSIRSLQVFCLAGNGDYSKSNSSFSHLRFHLFWTIFIILSSTFDDEINSFAYPHIHLHTISHLTKQKIYAYFCLCLSRAYCHTQFSTWLCFIKYMHKPSKRDTYNKSNSNHSNFLPLYSDLFWLSSWRRDFLYLVFFFHQ